uniref:Putative secreted peptide n=1 Tax=Anopheles braziliensis TaxID=58242 RepID=A0A2M3ZNP8_9DIPT
MSIQMQALHLRVIVYSTAAAAAATAAAAARRLLAVEYLVRRNDQLSRHFSLVVHVDNHIGTSRGSERRAGAHGGSADGCTRTGWFAVHLIDAQQTLRKG